MRAPPYPSSKNTAVWIMCKPSIKFSLNLYKLHCIINLSYIKRLSIWNKNKRGPRCILNLSMCLSKTKTTRGQGHLVLTGLIIKSVYHKCCIQGIWMNKLKNWNAQTSALFCLYGKALFSLNRRWHACLFLHLFYFAGMKCINFQSN